MKNITNPSNTKYLPIISSDFTDILQTEIYDAISSLLPNEALVLSGCLSNETSGITTITGGIVYINGKFIRFAGGTFEFTPVYMIEGDPINTQRIFQENGSHIAVTESTVECVDDISESFPDQFIVFSPKAERFKNRTKKKVWLQDSAVLYGLTSSNGTVTNQRATAKIDDDMVIMTGSFLVTYPNDTITDDTITVEFGGNIPAPISEGSLQRCIGLASANIPIFNGRIIRDLGNGMVLQSKFELPTGDEELTYYFSIQYQTESKTQF